MAARDDASASGLAARTLNGVSWSFLSTVVSMVATVVSTAILARLLTPSAFGLFAMAGVVLRFGAYFAQLGVGAAIVQRRELDGEDIKACLGVSLAMGLFFGALFYFVGPALARVVFDSSDLAPVIQALAFSFVLNGLAVTAVALLRRRMRFRWLAITDAGAYLLGYAAVSIGMAMAGAGVWSLVAGALAQSALTALFAYLGARHPLRISVRWGTYKSMLSYGGRISLSSFLEFLGYSIEPVVVGRFLGAAQVGYFSSAQRLANYPVERVVTSTTRVLFPSFSQIQGDRDRLRRGFLTSYAAVGLLAVPLSLCIAIASPEIVAVVLGPRWGPVVTPLRVIALAVPFTVLSHVNGVLLDSVALLGKKMLFNAAYVVGGAALVLFGVRFGLLGVVVSYLLLEAGYWLATTCLLPGILEVDPRDLVKCHVPALLAGGLAGGCTLLVATGGVALHAPPLPLLLLEVAAGLAGLFVLFRLPFRSVRFVLATLADAIEGGGMVRPLPGVKWFVRRFASVGPPDDGADAA